MKIRDRRFRCDLCGRYSDIGVTEQKPQATRASVVCKDCIWKAGCMIADHDDGSLDGEDFEDSEDPSEVAGGDEGAPDNEVDPLGDEPGDEDPETVADEDPATQDEPDEDAETVETG